MSDRQLAAVGKMWPQQPSQPMRMAENWSGGRPRPGDAYSERILDGWQILSDLGVVNTRGIVTLRGSTSRSCDRSGNGSCAQNPWEPAGTRSNQLRKLKSIFSVFFAFYSLF